MSEGLTVIDAQATVTSAGEGDVAACTDEWSLARTGQVRVVVNAVMFTADGQLVLLERRSAAPFAQLWMVPSGAASVVDAATGEFDLGLAADAVAERVSGLPVTQAVLRMPLGAVTSSMSDPRFTSVHASATAYVLPSGVECTAGDDAGTGPRWVRVDALASGQEVLAFEDASWLARASAPDGLVPDADRHAAFVALAQAALVRNAGVVTRVNAVRNAVNVATIPVDWAELSAAKAALRAGMRSGLLSVELEDDAPVLSQRAPWAASS